LSNYNKNKNDKLNWICVECEQDINIKKNVTSRMNRQENDKIIDTNNDGYITGDIHEIKLLISKVQSKFNSLTPSYSAFEKSMSFLSGKVDEYNLKLQSIIQKVNNNETKLE